AEAKALAGSDMTSRSGCVQVKGTGGNCVVTEVQQRIGLDTANTTYDGRWQMSTAQLTVSGTPPGLTGTISVAGIGGTAAGISLAIFAPTTGVVLPCGTRSAPPTA